MAIFSRDWPAFAWHWERIESEGVLYSSEKRNVGILTRSIRLDERLGQHLPRGVFTQGFPHVISDHTQRWAANLQEQQGHSKMDDKFLEEIYDVSLGTLMRSGSVTEKMHVQSRRNQHGRKPRGAWP